LIQQPRQQGAVGGDDTGGASQIVLKGQGFTVGGE